MTFDLRVPASGRRPLGGIRARLHGGHNSRSEAHLHALVAGADRPVVLAADEQGAYELGTASVPPPASPDPEPVGDLRAAVADAAAAIERAQRIAATRGVSAGGEIAGLVELLAVLDRGYATAVELADRIESEALAERHLGLPLESVLALKSRTTYGDRRFLTGARDTLRHLPNVWRAFRAGRLGWGQVRAIVAQARPLTVALRGELDARFADSDELGRLQSDEVVDRACDTAGRLREDLQRHRAVNRHQRRYLHAQASFEGGVHGSFNFPDEDGALLLEALEAAAAAPTGARDVTRDATDPTDPHHGATDGDGDDHGGFDRPRARQFADAMVRLAEAYLAGRRSDGATVRARPTLLGVIDVNDLIGASERARRARLLWRLPGTPPALTRDAVRRLSSDADLQFLLVDGHEVLGISAPTPAIPARLRRAVVARDQGCRFPGCRAPVAWTDLHHVLPRERGGHTTLDNLVCICRRHHMAVTEGRWRLAMARDGTVTVRRGRHTATSDPPLRRHPRSP